MEVSMKNGSLALAALLAGLAAVSRGEAAPVNRDDFQVETTANLVSLCSAAATDPLYTAAQNFCHGFATATYRMITVQQAATRGKRQLFCMPTPQPTRDQAIAAFTQWASDRPKTLASSPSDGIVEYLVTQYPCS